MQRQTLGNTRRVFGNKRLDEQTANGRRERQYRDGLNQRKMSLFYRERSPSILLKFPMWEFEHFGYIQHKPTKILGRSIEEKGYGDFDNGNLHR